MLAAIANPPGVGSLRRAPRSPQCGSGAPTLRHSTVRARDHSRCCVGPRQATAADERSAIAPPSGQRQLDVLLGQLPAAILAKDPHVAAVRARRQRSASTNGSPFQAQSPGQSGAQCTPTWAGSPPRGAGRIHPRGRARARMRSAGVVPDPDEQLAFEVKPIQRPGCDADAVGDRLNRGGRVATLFQQLACGLHQSHACVAAYGGDATLHASARAAFTRLPKAFAHERVEMGAPPLSTACSVR